MKEAAEETVKLYEYVYNNEPVTFAQIVEHALPPAMRHTAYESFRKHRDEAGEELPDAWFEIDRNKEVAWYWWVGELVTSSRETKRFSVTTQDGSRAQGKRRDQLLYSIARTKSGQPQNRPMVRTSAGNMVGWSPEFALTHVRAVAAQRVVQRAEQAIAKTAAIPDRKDRDFVIGVLKDALDAVRNSSKDA